MRCEYQTFRLCPEGVGKDEGIQMLVLDVSVVSDWLFTGDSTRLVLQKRKLSRPDALQRDLGTVSKSISVAFIRRPGQQNARLYCFDFCLSTLIGKSLFETISPQ